MDHRQLREENRLLRESLGTHFDRQNIIGRSPAMEKVLKTVAQVAPSEATVLITGESGTGKEMIARAIHFNSPRKDGPFVNAEILSNGYAYLLYHRPNIKHNSVMLQSQRAAMSAKKGIWQNWTERKKNYVANKRSRRFHLPACPFGKRIKPQNRVVFQTKWEAFWEGYAPAKRCMPVFEIPED